MCADSPAKSSALSSCLIWFLKLASVMYLVLELIKVIYPSGPGTRYPREARAVAALLQSPAFHWGPTALFCQASGLLISACSSLHLILPNPKLLPLSLHWLWCKSKLRTKCRTSPGQWESLHCSIRGDPLSIRNSWEGKRYCGGDLHGTFLLQVLCGLGPMIS